MLNISLRTPVSLLIAGTALGCSLLLPKPAQAATFNFSYTFGPYNDIPAGSLLSGVLEGDLQPDGNTVTNISRLSATFRFANASSVSVFDGLYPNLLPALGRNVITLDGSKVTLFGWNSELGVNDFSEYLGFGLTWPTNPNGFPGSASVFFVETFVDEPFDPSRWSATLVTDSARVPEPGSLIALALFSTGCLMTGIRARSSKSAKPS